MDVLKSQNSLISKVIGIQEHCNGKCRLLNFVIPVKVNDGVLLYNNLTKELVRLTENEYNIVENNDMLCENELQGQLKEKWFIVPDNFNDTKFSDQIYNIARLSCMTSEITVYKILTTTACNARCNYCYEKGTKAISMNAGTAEHVADFILDKSGSKDVNLEWFGGEPLCNISAIDKIIDVLNANNKEYKSSMVSNAYLFDDELIKKAKEKWKLNDIQITIDGTNDYYKHIKNYKNDDNDPLKRVLNNIDCLLKNKVYVIIRLNLCFENEKDLYSLVDYLKKRYSDKEYLSVYCHMIFSAANYSTNWSDKQIDELGEKYLRLRKYIIDCGLYNTPALNKSIRTACCIADSPNSVLISPEGKLGKCEQHIDDDFTGDVFSHNSPLPEPWSDYTEMDSKCFKCPVYPTCIRLKRCESEQKCFEYDQERYVDDLIIAVKNEYENQINKDLNA